MAVYLNNQVYERKYTMLDKTQMQEIQDLKLQGYTKTEIARYYKERGLKVPSRPTISKYYEMDVVPENPGEKLSKAKAFDVSPFKEAIIAILENNAQKDFCISSVYDVLCEMYVENGSYSELPGNEQTLRNYVHYLENSNQIDRNPEHLRVYNHVFDTPPGEQMLIDFGEYTINSKSSVFFICLLLRYSRMLYVYAQDHKYNAAEACQAIYRCFCRIGGRPRVLVIDQDAVFVSSEIYGEVVKTRVFEDFCTEQDLRLWVCNKADPESKGPIENSVGYVKKNFFSARNITCIDDVWRSLPGWVERKSKRIHQATYRIPEEVFRDFEKEALRPLLQSVYETSPGSYKSYEIKSTPYVLYKSCYYSVPQSCAYSTVRYKIVSGRINIYDENYKFICTHNLSERKGSYNQLDAHKKADGGDWIEIMEDMRSKWNCYDFQHFINGLKKENPRHMAKQLLAISRYLDSQKPEKSFVAAVMKECCENFRYTFSQFKTVFELRRAGSKLPNIVSLTEAHESAVEYKSLNTYTKAFYDRIEREACTE